MAQIINDERYKRGNRPYTQPTIPEQSDESGVDGVEVKKVITGTLANGAATNQQQQANNASTQTTNQQNNNTSTQTAQTTTATPVVPIANTSSIEKTTTVDVTPEKIVYNATEAPSDKEIAKTSENLVTYDDGRNAVRDFGRYVKYNSYGDSYDWEQIQNSMKPDDIIAFQKAHGLPQTGIIGKKTYALLKSEWDKQQLYEEQLGNNLANALKPNAEDGNKGKNYLVKETIATELKDWIDRYGNAEPTDLANGAVSELQTILKELGKTNPRIQEILVDDKFGEQTMTTFMQALFTDSDLQAALGLRDANGKKNIKAYSHIMDMLRNDGGDEHAEYVRNYALRQQERNKKFQTLGEIVGLIRDSLVASGGVDPGKRDNSAKFQSIQKYADEANKNYRDYIAERNKTILGLEKASEDAEIKQDAEEAAREHDWKKSLLSTETQKDIANWNNLSAEKRQRIPANATRYAADIEKQWKQYVADKGYAKTIDKAKLDNETKVAIQILKSSTSAQIANRKSFSASIKQSDKNWVFDNVGADDMNRIFVENGIDLPSRSNGKNAPADYINKIDKLDPAIKAKVMEQIRQAEERNKQEIQVNLNSISYLEEKLEEALQNNTANVSVGTASDSTDSELPEDMVTYGSI